jgi:peroxidase
LSEIIFRPHEAYNKKKGGLDTIIEGLLYTPSAKYDAVFSEALRNHLFEVMKRQTPSQTKRLDLLAININRGRDHGLPSVYSAPIHNVFF